MTNVQAITAPLMVGTELKNSDDNLIELVTNRLSELQDLERAEEMLIARNLELVIERNAANKVVRELTEQNKGLQSQLEQEEVIKTGLKAALEAMDPQFDALLEKIKHLENENNSLVGRTEMQRKELSNIKKLGDPTTLIANNKKFRAKNSDLTKELKLEKDKNRKLIKANTQLLENAKKTAHEKGDERLLFTSSKDESLYLHPKVLTIRTPRGTHKYVALRFWTVHGLGRLITWNGEMLNFGDTKDERLNKLLAPSKEVQSFAIGWYKKNVITVDGRQELKIEE